MKYEWKQAKDLTDKDNVYLKENDVGDMRGPYNIVAAERGVDSMTWLAFTHSLYVQQPVTRIVHKSTYFLTVEYDESDAPA
jgi:intein/homing endonuclease